MKSLLYLLLFTTSALRAQVATITLLDATTHQPIPNAEAYYPTTLNGTITNAEGKLRINIENDTLTLSHIGYQTKKIFTPPHFNTTTIHLQPYEIQLDEVVVYNYPLKEKVKYVIDNYFKLYDTQSKILEITYREKYLKNDTLIRLYQVQLDWWSKNHILQFKKSLNDNLHIHLKNTDYSKISNPDEGVNSAFFYPNFILPYLHLNFYLIALNNAKDIEIKKVEKDHQHTIVTFNAQVYINKNEPIDLQNSVIYFDKNTQAIKQISFTQKPTNGEGISQKKKIPYKTFDNKGTWQITFTPYKNKLLFSSYSIKGSIIFQYQGKTDQAYIEQSFLRTGVKEGGHIKKSDRIDVNNPFFQYITPHKPNQAKFILTTAEQDFINQ